MRNRKRLDARGVEPELQEDVAYPQGGEPGSRPAGGGPASSPVPAHAAAGLSAGTGCGGLDGARGEGPHCEPLGAAASEGGRTAGQQQVATSGAGLAPGARSARRAGACGKERTWWGFLTTYQNIQLSLCTLVYFALCVTFHTYATGWSWYRGVVKYNMVGTPPLNDLLHELLPNTQSMRVLPEIGHVLPVLYLSGLMLYHFDQRSLDCFRTFLWCHGTLLVMRCLSFLGTTLPDASQQCHVSLFMGSCHDLIFSGHVMIMMLATLFVQHFFYVHPVVRVFTGLNTAVVALLVVSSHNHYTVDVVLALIAALFGFIAFTRHPVLVALGTADPSKVLAKPGFGDLRRKGGFCGCSREAWGDPTGEVDEDGYVLLPAPASRSSSKLRAMRTAAVSGRSSSSSSSSTKGSGSSAYARQRSERAEATSSSMAAGDASGLRQRRRAPDAPAHSLPASPIASQAHAAAGGRGSLPRIAAPRGPAGSASVPASPHRGGRYGEEPVTPPMPQYQQAALLAAVARDVSAAAGGAYAPPAPQPRSRPASASAPDALLVLVQQLLLQQPELAAALAAGTPARPSAGVPPARTPSVPGRSILPGLAERSISCDSPDFDASVAAAAGLSSQEAAAAAGSSGASASDGPAGLSVSTSGLPPAAHVPTFSPLAAAAAGAALGSRTASFPRSRHGSSSSAAAMGLGSDGASNATAGTADTEASDPTATAGPASPLLQRPASGNGAHLPAWQGLDPQSGAASLALAAALADQLRALVGPAVAPAGRAPAPRARDRSASESSAAAGAALGGAGVPGWGGAGAFAGVPSHRAPYGSAAASGYPPYGAHQAHYPTSHYYEETEGFEAGDSGDYELEDEEGDPVLLERLHVRARGLLTKWGQDAAAFRSWVANVRAGGSADRGVDLGSSGDSEGSRSLPAASEDDEEAPGDSEVEGEEGGAGSGWPRRAGAEA